MKSFKEQEKLDKILADYKVKCKNCGHVVIMRKNDKKVCNWCGHYIFGDDKEEFKYRLSQKLRKY